MTYAAIYIKPDKPKMTVIDNIVSNTIEGQLKQAFNNAKNNIKNFDLKSFANNLTIEGVTDFTHKYATAALTHIINGEKITNQSMIDALFNGFAPALDMTAVQLNYNNILEMKTAITSGNINVTNFINGFSGNLKTIINNKKQNLDYSYLGDEITIDMIVDIDRQNIAETPDRRVQSGQVYNEYIHILPKVLSFTGKIKDGGKYTADEYEEILNEIFESKKPFTFRAGEKVFENYVFTSFIPANNFEQSLNFSAELKKIDVGDIVIQKVNIPKSTTASKQKTIKKNTNSQTGSEAQSIKNKTAPKKIYGVGRLINLDKGVDSIINTLNEWK